MTELNFLLERFPTLDHVSLYQLTLERGTALWKSVAAGNLAMPEEDCVADMYEAAIEILSKAGIHRYEVSNFARSKEKVNKRVIFCTDMNYSIFLTRSAVTTSGTGLAANISASAPAHTGDSRRPPLITRPQPLRQGATPCRQYRAG